MNVTAVKLSHCYGVTIEYQAYRKLPSYKLSLNNLTKSYPVPQGVSQMHEAYAILMDRFYGDFNIDLPKNGFEVFRIKENLDIAIPLQN